MDKNKITNHQFFCLTAGGAFGGAVIVISPILAQIAKQDAWITTIITPIYGVLIILFLWYFGSRFPGMTYVGIIRQVFGKWIGTAVSALFVLICLIIACHFPWYVADFYSTVVMPETPPFAIILLFLVALIIGLLYGLKAIARAFEIFIIFASFLLLLAALLAAPKIEINNILPVFENGLAPVLKSSVHLSSVMTFPCFLLLMIYPRNVETIKGARRPLIVGYLWAALLIFVTITMTLLVLGARLTASANFPSYLLATEIDVGIIFSRLEFMISTVWIFTHLYHRLFVFLYAGLMGLTEILGLRDYRKIVLPVGLIVLVYSGVAFNDVIHSRRVCHGCLAALQRSALHCTAGAAFGY
jgi:spore germination protein KB